MGLGRKKMPLPWSDELQEMMIEKYGEEYKAYLPFLFVDTTEQKLGVQMRFDYMDFVSLLYQKNFSDMIGTWCREHGVEYIGHVVEDNGIHSRLGMGAAHFFRAMSGQDMAGIDCIGGQIVYGAPVQTRKGMTESDGEFFHYALGKLGASCGHLDPKKQGRTMCELFGAYGWNFGVRDMKYLLDHLLVKGVNHLVPHAFSMAEYPDIDCPPHFYARGNNPEFPYFAELMKYANRMCGLLNGGVHAASVAVLYDGEADWSGEHMPMQKVCRELLEHQIDLDIVSLDMLCNLEKYHGSVNENKLEINGESFGALIVPYTKHISGRLAAFIRKADVLPVFFVDKMPEDVINQVNEGEIDEAANCRAVPLQALSEELKAQGHYEVEVDQEFKKLSFYHYRTDRDIVVLFNESAEQVFQGRVRLPIPSEPVYYSAMTEKYETADYECAADQNGQNCVRVYLELEPGESCVLMEKKEISCGEEHRSFRQQTENCEAIDLSCGWNVSKVKAKAYPEFLEGAETETLEPISKTEPPFAGVIRYEKTIELKKAPEEAYLKAEHVYEVMKVTVNGETAGIRLIPPYQIAIGGLLKNGANKIEVEVATTPARDQLNYPMPPFDFSHEAMEPTGMFGTVTLYRK